MQKSALLLALLLLVSSVVIADDQQVTLSGEVVDLHCYTTRDAKGEDHAGCSNACISRGVPAALLTEDGTLYLLISEKPVSVKDKIAGLAGKKVKASGKVVERSGMKALQLASIE